MERKKYIELSIHQKINFKGNREQHRTIGGYLGYKNPTRKYRRKGVVISNKHLTKKTGKSINYFEFY